MGTCFQKQEKSSYHHSETGNRKTHSGLNSQSQSISAAGDKNIYHKNATSMSVDFSEEFKDMEEWEGDKYRGEGIKRMKGYKCDLHIDELVKLREKFWASRHHNKHIWKVLKIASITDHIKSESLLQQNNIRTLKGCINICLDSDNNTYHIPNYCINDPYFEKELLPEHVQETDQVEKLSISLYDLYENKKQTIKLPSNLQGKEIKNLFAEMNNFDASSYKIRLLFGGAEILDDQYLYQHKLHNGYTIQVIKNKI